MAAPMRLTRCVLRRLLGSCNGINPVLLCTSSATQPKQPVRDPLLVFMQDEVQSLLQRITGFDLMKLAGPHKVPLRKPVYKLLTNQELKELQDAASNRMKLRLQMPPFMKCREPITEVLASNPELADLETHKIIFTDITFGVKNRQRLIVVREPDGTLRKASWEERDRINQIYHPILGRQLITPEMFNEVNLERLLKEQKYVYVLDAACVQYEPDSPDYIRVTHRTFESIDSTHGYELLRSTRHFGPMAFYYAWYKKMDYLLIDMINRNMLSDTGDLIRLYCIIHPVSAIAKQLTSQPSADFVATIKAFLSLEASHKGQLELAIQGYEESTRVTPPVSAVAS